MRKLLIITLLILASVVNVFSQGNVSVKTEVDKTEITIGDLINYSFTVTATKDAEIKMPPSGINLGMFEIRDYKIYDPAKKANSIIYKSTYTITTYDTGSYKIPSLPILYKFPSDTADKVLYTDPVEIRINSVKPSEAKDIRDIKPPLDFKRRYRNLILMIIAIVLIVILVILAYIFFRKRKGKDIFSIFKEPELPPDEKAIKELQELEKSNLIKEGKLKEYYIILSNIIRKYFEGRYFFPSLEKTTMETLENLEKYEVQREVIEKTRRLLEDSDFVKFAKYRPSEQEIMEDFNLAKDIIEQTRLVFEAQKEENSKEDLIKYEEGKSTTVTKNE